MSWAAIAPPDAGKKKRAAGSRASPARRSELWREPDDERSCSILVENRSDPSWARDFRRYLHDGGDIQVHEHGRYRELHCFGGIAVPPPIGLPRRALRMRPCSFLSDWRGFF